MTRKKEYRQKPSEKNVKLLLIGIIVLVSFGVYFNALSNGFVYDDDYQILNNRWITEITYIPTIFSSSVWAFSSDSIANYYRPIMHVIYMFNYYIFGLTPWGFHLVNIFFHAGVSVLVFLIIASLLGDKRPEHTVNENVVNIIPAPFSLKLRRGWVGLISPAFIAALIFSTHPIHTEAVTWIAGITDLSYTFFLLLSLYLYMRSEEEVTPHERRLTWGYENTQTVITSEESIQNFKRNVFPITTLGMTANNHIFGSKVKYALSLLSFSIAALSKEPALTLPFILMVYDYCCSNSSSALISKWGIKKRIYFRRYIPYFIITAIYLGFRYYAIRAIFPLRTGIILSSYGYVINVFPLFLQYLKDLLLPLNLNAYHMLHPISSIMEPVGILSLTLTVFFFIAAGVALKKKNKLSLSLALIALPLMPALYIPAVGEAAFAERYLYLPSFGFVTLIAMFLAWAGYHKPKMIVYFSIVSMLLVGLYSLQTINRNIMWKNDCTLWADTVKKSPDAPTPHYNLGNAYAEQNCLPEAINEYMTALRLKPDHTNAQFNLALTYAKQNRLFVEHYNLAITYVNHNRLADGINEFQAALKIRPDSVQAKEGLDVSYEKLATIVR